MHAWTLRWLVTIGGAGMVAAWLGSGGCSPSSDRPPAAAAESPAIPAPAVPATPRSRTRPRPLQPLRARAALDPPDLRHVVSSAAVSCTALDPAQ